jgi:hypothetical protein
MVTRKSIIGWNGPTIYAATACSLYKTSSVGRLDLSILNVRASGDGSRISWTKMVFQYNKDENRTPWLRS